MIINSRQSNGCLGQSNEEIKIRVRMIEQPSGGYYIGSSIQGGWDLHWDLFRGYENLLEKFIDFVCFLNRCSWRA